MLWQKFVYFFYLPITLEVKVKNVFLIFIFVANRMIHKEILAPQPLSAL